MANFLWKSPLGLGILGIICTVNGCKVSKLRCLRSEVYNQQFRYFTHGHPSGYFMMNDSTHFEFVNGELYAQSDVIWKGCDQYFLIPRKVKYQDGIRPGDTLNVTILSLKDDTLTYVATAYGLSHKSQAIKEKKL